MVPQTSRIVGKAIHEIVLTAALSQYADRIFPPGTGRSLVIIPEADIGRGRPDVLVVVMSKTALKAYLKSGLHVESLAVARTLVAGTVTTSGKTGTRKTASKVGGKSWTPAEVRRYTRTVFDSLAVEAKMKDWKQAVRQASRFRHLAHRGAIMLPESASLDRVEPYLRTYDLGLISFASRTPSWSVSASKAELHPGHALWLLELAAREIRSRFPQLP